MSSIQQCFSCVSHRQTLTNAFINTVHQHERFWPDNTRSQMKMHVQLFCFCRLVDVSLFLFVSIFFFFNFAIFFFVMFLPFVAAVLVGDGGGACAAARWFFFSLFLYLDCFVDCERCARTIASNVRHRCCTKDNNKSLYIQWYRLKMFCQFPIRPKMQQM